MEFGTSICYEAAVCFNYKHSDGGTGGGCSVVAIMSPLVSLICTVTVELAVVVA